ncbi:hypothetical protein [Leptolyngbya sp. 7M]|uniref:hypothetical protein n=1 Tax=Leptolyngbya sp. 7M TaxID=2812896 RepID=UPI001B8AEEA9|nr:hypothetical protein [Leptolyngbya sp. 7M]QYO64628.1 hypothetical protein JVX88_34230 [Leptolyngbya sp. 7M]
MPPWWYVPFPVEPLGSWNRCGDPAGGTGMGASHVDFRRFPGPVRARIRGEGGPLARHGAKSHPQFADRMGAFAAKRA